MAQVLKIMNMVVYTLFIKELILSQKKDGRVDYYAFCRAYRALWRGREDFDTQYAYRVFMAQYGGHGPGEFPGFEEIRLGKDEQAIEAMKSIERGMMR